MRERYIFYWLKSDGTKVYHLDEVFGTPWQFDTYQEVFEVSQRLSRPSVDSKPYFEVVKL